MVEAKDIEGIWRSERRPPLGDVVRALIRFVPDKDSNILRGMAHSGSDEVGTEVVVSSGFDFVLGTYTSPRLNGTVRLALTQPGVLEGVLRADGERGEEMHQLRFQSVELEERGEVATPSEQA